MTPKTIYRQSPFYYVQWQAIRYLRWLVDVDSISPFPGAYNLLSNASSDHLGVIIAFH